MQLEMMSDAIDETLDKDEAEEETEELTNQVTSSQLADSGKFYFAFGYIMDILSHYMMAHIIIHLLCRCLMRLV